MFQKDSTKKDGLKTVCRSCSNKRDRIYREQPEIKELGRERARGYYHDNSDYIKLKRKLYSELNPLKRYAQKQVEKAIINGTLVRPLECRCGSNENIQAHHDDYNAPLDVRWLCSKCHMRLHGELNTNTIKG